MCQCVAIRNRDDGSSEEIALTNIFRGAGPTADEIAIQRGISQAMAGVIADASAAIQMRSRPRLR